MNIFGGVPQRRAKRPFALAGTVEKLPETGWAWQGYLGYYEVDLHVSLVPSEIQE